MLGMLVQRFDFVDHLDYELKTKTTLTVKPDDFHILVRPRPGFQIDRTGPEPAATSRVQPAAPATAAAPRRPARHAAVGAVRLEPRHRRVDRHQARAGGHRARLRRHPRRARRPRRRPPARRRRARSSARPTTAPPRTTPPRSARWIRGAAEGAADGVAYSVFGCGNTEWAVDLPGRADPARRRARRARRPPDPRPRRGQRGRRLRRRLPRLARRALGRPGHAPWTCRPRWARPRRPPARGCRSR